MCLKTGKTYCNDRNTFRVHFHIGLQLIRKQEVLRRNSLYTLIIGGSRRGGAKALLAPGGGGGGQGPLGSLFGGAIFCGEGGGGAKAPLSAHAYNKNSLHV